MNENGVRTEFESSLRETNFIIIFDFKRIVQTTPFQLK